MNDDDDYIDFTEEVERGWRDHMHEFKEKVYPMFKEQGFTLPEAWACWDANRIKNALDKLLGGGFA